jgi:hypothetical protein
VFWSENQFLSGLTSEKVYSFTNIMYVIVLKLPEYMKAAANFLMLLPDFLYINIFY